jgi:hypothetical protein
MQANRFSSCQHSTQGLFNVDLVSEVVSSTFVCSFVISTVIGSATDDVGANISFALITELFDEAVESDGETSCS